MLVGHTSIKEMVQMVVQIDGKCSTILFFEVCYKNAILNIDLYCHLYHLSNRDGAHVLVGPTSIRVIVKIDGKCISTQFLTFIPIFHLET